LQRLSKLFVSNFRAIDGSARLRHDLLMRSNLLGRATSYALSTPSAPILCFEPEPDFQTRRRLLSRAIDPVRPNEKVGWNFPCFTKLVDHVYRERASASENFGRTRARAQEFGKLALCVP
jgi:hypothetical protein